RSPCVPPAHCTGQLEMAKSSKKPRRRQVAKKAWAVPWLYTTPFDRKQQSPFKKLLCRYLRVGPKSNINPFGDVHNPPVVIKFSRVIASRRAPDLYPGVPVSSVERSEHFLKESDMKAAQNVSLNARTPLANCGLHILVAEDDRDMAQSTAILLRFYGHS